MQARKERGPEERIRFRGVAKRWTRAEAQEVLRRLQQSGLSVRQFAKREGLDIQRLYKWRSRLNTSQSAADGAVRFAEVTIGRVSPPAGAADGFEIVLERGRLLRVGRDFDPAALKRLLEVLES